MFQPPCAGVCAQGPPNALNHGGHVKVGCLPHSIARFARAGADVEKGQLAGDLDR